MSIPRLILVLTAFLCVCVSGADLGPGDRLPDCSKVPVLTVQQAYRTDLHDVPSLEQLLIPDGVTVVRFCSPRAPRGGAFRSFFLKELSSLKKGMHNMPYPCRVVPVIPLGDTVLLASFDGNVYALRQSKPISVWTDKDVVPRWFMAALARQLYQESAELIVRAGKGEPGAELVLTQFDDLLKQIRAQVANPGTAPRVLPRDVPAEHPGAPFVEYVLTAGLLGGYPDGTFRPSEPTNRYQFASALASVLDWVTRPDYTWRTLKTENMAGVQVEVRTDPVEGRPPIQPADVPSSHWANNAITQQAQKGLLQVDAEGYFRGERQVTLADAREQWNLIAASVKVVRTE
ncbi:MAG: S-layer homology domain-containing protein [Armatimonadetes bacterium]|nr:S-layer homology domain-containing protein [Armatimonadota bacterium]